MRMVLWIASLFCWNALSAAPADPAVPGRELSVRALTASPSTFEARADDSRVFTWWLPPDAVEYVLPIAAGVNVAASDTASLDWLRQGSPWELKELPVFGGRYGTRTLVVIVPWPHYAELIIADRVGVRFSFPEGRNNATPCRVVAQWAGPEPLEVARVFRDWRRTTTNLGGLPRPRPLSMKAMNLPHVSRLYGAPHFYLWGPGMFCRHDVDRDRWIPLARALLDAPAESVAARLRRLFIDEERQALRALADAQWPDRHLTSTVAEAINRALSNRAWSGFPDSANLGEIVESNRWSIAEALEGYVHEPRTWGDGLSLTLLEAMHDAGIERALLLLSDLYAQTVRPEVGTRAAELGYLLGPYDSYHSVHSPAAESDQTWATAQFDQVAFDEGRVLNADGRGHAGFRGRGYHFSPIAARPYVERRVSSVLQNNVYSAWFMDCDATAECFDDFHPDHPATRVEDVNARRERLRWLEWDQRLVVGSEGGSVLFADVIHFGHGTHTPYMGHLDPAFRDPQSRHFLGRHWPADTPENSFKPVPLPPSLRSPYFDPRLRIPLYQAAVGDELIATHHWSFDSLKLSDVEPVRQLMEILYLVPPMYHLNRETWPQRRERIMQHLRFWSPLHRQLATLPLIRFEWLSEDRMAQRTVFQAAEGEVTILVNFSNQPRAGQSPFTAVVTGPIDLEQRSYRLDPN